MFASLNLPNITLQKYLASVVDRLAILTNEGGVGRRQLAAGFGECFQLSVKPAANSRFAPTAVGFDFFVVVLSTLPYLPLSMSVEVCPDDG
jgi:hypothetical protein